jgi:hypothetical protein
VFSFPAFFFIISILYLSPNLIHSFMLLMSMISFPVSSFHLSLHSCMQLLLHSKATYNSCWLLVPAFPTFPHLYRLTKAFHSGSPFSNSSPCDYCPFWAPTPAGIHTILPCKADLACHLKPICLLGIFFNSENGGIVFL